MHEYVLYIIFLIMLFNVNKNLIRFKYLHTHTMTTRSEQQNLFYR